MGGVAKPCLACGALTEDSRCPTCARQFHNLRRRGRHPSKSNPEYDTAWRKVRDKARRLQPWCSRCGATEDLTCDHSEEAWKRKAAGKPIRLCDVDVLCRSCNARKGPARAAA